MFIIPSRNLLIRSYYFTRIALTFSGRESTVRTWFITPLTFSEPKVKLFCGVRFSSTLNENVEKAATIPKILLVSQLMNPKQIFNMYVLVDVGVDLIGLPLKIEMFSLGSDVVSFADAFPNNEPPLTDFELFTPNENTALLGELLDAGVDTAALPKLNIGVLALVLPMDVSEPKVNDAPVVEVAAFVEESVLPKLKRLVGALVVVVGIPNLNSDFEAPNTEGAVVPSTLDAVEPNTLVDGAEVAAVPSFGVVHDTHVFVSFLFLT